MRRACSVIVLIVWYSSSFGQGKVPYSINNGLQIVGIDATNPVIYDNDLIVDTPDIFYLWLKAHKGQVNLVGNINTRDMYNQPNYQYSHDDTFVQWVNLYNKAQASNLQNIPAPVKGTSIALVKPASGVIEQTQYTNSVGSDLIIAEAHKASAAKPLVIFVGGNVSSIANAYLKDNSIADKVIVLHIAGYRYNSATYNTTDFWSSYVVMKRFRYVNWSLGWGRNIPVDLTGMPDNPFTQEVRGWYNNAWAIYHDLSDSPVVLWFFDHSLWTNVARKLENDQTTTSDTYDYLLVTENNYDGYGPLLGSYLRDPANYVAGPTNSLPTVSLTAPANNANFNTGSTVTLTANASDSDGSISRVEFFNGNTKIGEDLTSPYSFAWANVGAGTYTITAKATDNQNAVKTSAAVTITVTSPNTPPSVAITAPANNTSFAAGASVTISANASDNASVAKVEFFNGNTKLGEDTTSPYSFVWANVPAGTLTITAVATDNQNATTTSAAITINVTGNASPTVSLTAPANNTSFAAGSAITLTATAADANGSVTKVEFYNGATKLGEDTSSPYSFVFASVPVGTYTFTAKATDNQNAQTTSAVANVTVIADNVPPTVSLTAPTNNASFTAGSNITLNATAADADGTIAKVEFFNGTTKLGEDATSPYSFVWNNVIAGNYELTAKATDNKNAASSSAKVSVSVNAVNTVPVVEITSPVSNTMFPTGTAITINVNASDANGNITKVEFFSGTTKLGEDLTSPYSFTWNDIPAGSYALTAKATDNLNANTTSEPVTITIKSTVNPTANPGDDVFLTLPANSTTLTGSGTSSDGSSLKYLWTQVSGPSTVVIPNAASQTISLTGLSEGTYVFELTVTDGKGLVGSDQIKITVAADLIVQGAIPRYFTPNGDGVNDFWEWPQTELFEKSILMIFDRSGKKVFETANYNNTWDGKSDGKQLSDDAYYYIIRLYKGDDIKGAVRIVR